MNKVVVRDYRKGDFDNFEPRYEVDNKYLENNLSNLIKSCPDLVAKTIGVDGMVLGIMGLTPWLNGTYEAWSVISKHAKDRPIAFHRETAYIIDYYMDKLKIRRMHCFIKADDELAIKWIRSLSFEREGLLRKFGEDGSDHYVYGRIA